MVEDCVVILRDATGLWSAEKAVPTLDSVDQLCTSTLTKESVTFHILVVVLQVSFLTEQHNLMFNN